MINVRILLKIAPDTRIGPGKVRLLEAIEANGSISAAARTLDMTYRRAWELIDHMNKAFGRPLVSGHTGGAGGAELTALGRDVVARYRQIETEARTLCAPHVAALEAMMATDESKEGPA